MSEDPILEQVNSAAVEPVAERPAADGAANSERAAEAAEVSQGAENGTGSGKRKPPDGWQKRINKLTAKYYHVEAENHQLKQELARLGSEPREEDPPDLWVKRRNEQVKNGVVSQGTHDWLKAEVARTGEAMESTAREEAAVREQAEAATGERFEGAEPAATPLTEEEKQHFEAQNKFVARVGAKMATDEKFAQAATAIGQIGAKAEVIDFVSHILADLPNGMEVFQALGKNPGILRSMEQMAPAHAGALLEEISTELGQGGQEGAAASSAPAPITPVRKVAPTVTGLSDDLPGDEWNKRRWAQIAAKQRRG